MFGGHDWGTLNMSTLKKFRTEKVSKTFLLVNIRSKLISNVQIMVALEEVEKTHTHSKMVRMSCRSSNDANIFSKEFG